MLCVKFEPSESYGGLDVCSLTLASGEVEAELEQIEKKKKGSIAIEIEE